MKKFLFSLIVLLVGAQSLLSQPDLQWIVVNGNGKSGTEAINEILINKYQNPINNSIFTLHGVRHPNRNDFPEAKNNIFILYEDGMHFNSRESWVERERNYPTDFFFREANNTGYRSHQFDANHQSPVKYMYLTNVYEEDDPPIGLSVHSGLAVNTPVSGNYYPDITTPNNAISATHDITRGKDVTLIISKVELINEGIDPTEEFTLYFNKIFNKSTGNLHEGPFFSPSPIFKQDLNPVSYFYPFDPLNHSKNDFYIKISFMDPQYIYVNLRPQKNLEEYYPQTDDGEPTHAALFSVIQGNINVPHTEDLVSAHDPNFVQLCKLIRTRNNKTFLKYRVQFENASMQPASGLAVEFTFDNRFDLSNTKLKKIKAGQNTHRFGQNDGRLPRSFPPIPLCALENNGRTARVNFPSGWQVAAGGSRNNAIGYVDFIVRVDQDVRWERGEVPAMPMECKVFFKDIPFHVDVFKDIIIILKSNSQSYPEDGERRASTNASEYNASLPGCIQNL